MKKLLLFLIFLPLLVNAQPKLDAQAYKDYRDKVASEIGHYLTVKGVELKPGLEMKTLLNIMESKGFSKSEYFDYAWEDRKAYELVGSFFSHEGCSMTIIPTSSNKDVVGVVSIKFPNETSFKRLKEIYDNLKSSLSKKYFLHESTEKFDDNYIERTTSDNLKLLALANNEGTFKSVFYLTEDPSSLMLGQVVLVISHIKVKYDNFYYVSLNYCTSDNVLEQLISSEEDL